MRREPDGTVVYFPLDSPGCEVAVGWYLEMMPANTGNIMAMVFRDGPETPWKLVLRSRFYVDSDTTDKSKDERTGYLVERPATEEQRDELVKKATQIMDTLRVGYQGQLTTIRHFGPAESFVEKWSQLQFAHMRVEKEHGSQTDRTP
jgi:hypothetical protein